MRSLGRAVLLELRDEDGATLAWWGLDDMKKIYEDLYCMHDDHEPCPIACEFLGKLNALTR